ncbi:hypothetical protein ColTof4_09316 [Colletotrichum tofieldiae]|uniref:Uncharacterized protein n=1 Tax=Colletotrichum tofieldiae TaxID=708197 RepID=A0A166RJI3_9PEZI|nr:hypothetical protein CT0861_08790 [Colletotrichum tofieldiae]GKT65261.1 hypothetical protein ColTof3_12600 [Colletotrichum tofieldiae]GKT76893.1 hypothetical protein ColTof4_09316 [Colletotrichum tofieldiae]GKT92661.1 hypothetical protein Ct61P_10511 [Colletotrichum tofieldiae]
MDANNNRLLSEDNPFFLDYDLFLKRYGVSILQTPTLLNFAQLQNFLLRTATNRDWPYYFWSHMDVGILSQEDVAPYISLYHRVLQLMLDTGVGHNQDQGKWGMKMFQYDFLSLVNVAAWRQVGQWDVFVPYYGTDCDAYARLRMSGFSMDSVDVGTIWDVADHVPDPELEFFPPSSLINSTLGGFTGNTLDKREKLTGPLRQTFQRFQDEKQKNSAGRNTWQNKQKGGKGEPWTYDPTGFQAAWWQTAEAGRQLYAKKWGTSNCNLLDEQKKLSDMWKDAKEVTSRSIEGSLDGANSYFGTLDV